MSNFTPGPYYAAGPLICVDTPHGRAEIAMFYAVSEYVSVLDAEANMALFIAAPDLLAACRILLPSACQATSPTSPIYDNGRECGKCAYCIGKAAIAKAEGDA